jgi:hypothetical protein
MRAGRGGGFLASLVLNLAANIGWTVPAWVLLILHFVTKLSIWVFWAALGVFLLVIIITTAAIFMAAKSGDAPETVRENVNPYSNKGSYPDYKRNDTDL